MIKSMTGYGKANLSKNEREYQVEIRSVNHRYLDICVKMPKVLSYLEEDVKKEIAFQVKRGKIDVFITFENKSVERKEVKINTELAKIYIDELKKLAKQENLLSNIEVTEISKFPDALTIKSNENDEIIKMELLEAIRKATRKFSANEKYRGKQNSRRFNN